MSTDARRCKHSSTTARAARWPQDVTKPVLIDDSDAIIRVDATTICGSDLHIRRATSRRSPTDESSGASSTAPKPNMCESPSPTTRRTRYLARRDTMFKGETLRGLLLSAYAWSTVGHLAGIAAIAAFIAAALMLLLVVLGMVLTAES